MSAFGGEAEINRYGSKCPLIANSGHYDSLLILPARHPCPCFYFLVVDIICQRSFRFLVYYPEGETNNLAANAGWVWGKHASVRPFGIKHENLKKQGRRIARGETPVEKAVEDDEGEALTETAGD